MNESNNQYRLARLLCTTQKIVSLQVHSFTMPGTCTVVSVKPARSVINIAGTTTWTYQCFERERKIIFCEEKLKSGVGNIHNCSLIPLLYIYTKWILILTRTVIMKNIYWIAQLKTVSGPVLICLICTALAMIDPVKYTSIARVFANHLISNKSIHIHTLLSKPK